jgi:hypothetical protein
MVVRIFIVDVFFGFLTALILTIIIESFVAFLFGHRGRDTYFAIFAINLITNPVLNYVILIIQSVGLFNINFFYLLLLELIVILVEWRMLVYVLSVSSKKLLSLSMIMNLGSFLFGLLVNNF